MTTYVLDQAWHAERDRLRAIGAVFDELSVERSAPALRPGAAVLEVGAGTGDVARAYADRVGPTGRVVCLDLDPRFLVDLPPVCEVRRGDVRDAPLEDDAYDLVHARLLVEHLADDKLAVLRRLVAALRPRGWLLIEDVDFGVALATSGPDVTAVLAAVLQLMQTGGYDPYYGRRLPADLVAAGVVDVDVLAYCRPIPGSTELGIPPLDLLVAQFADRLLAAGAVTPAQLAAVTRLTHDPDVWGSGPLLWSARGRRA